MTLGENIAVVPTQTYLTKLDNILDGRYLSLEDNIFVENVIADLRHFVKRGEDKRSVLLFPPVNNYRRFLIHKVCEENLSKELSTFSVGQGFNRRTVVCLKNLVRKPSILNKSHVQTVQHLGDQISNAMVVERQPISPESTSPEHLSQNGTSKRVRAAPAIYRPPAARKLEALNAQVNKNLNITYVSPTIPVSSVASKTERTRSGTRQRRPDLQVYVPRAKRASMVDQRVVEQRPNHEEIISINHDTCAVKKNESELSLKSSNTSVNSNLEKANHILADIDCSDEENRRKMDIDNIVEKDFDSVQVEDNSVKEHLSNDLKDHVLKNGNSESASMIIVCEADDGNEMDNANKKNSEMVMCELEEQLESPPDSGNNSVNGGECNERSICKEDISDSSINLCAVFISDSKENDGLCDSEENTEHKNEHSGLSNECVGDSLESTCNTERILQPKDVTEIIDSKTKNKENHKEEKIVTARLTSGVLIISDPESSINLVTTLPRNEENLDKNNAVTRKNKSKHKPASNTVVQKTEIATTTNGTTIANTTTSETSLNPDECTWEMLFDDNGDCLDPKIMEELTNAVGSVNIEKPQSDYNRFITRPEINLPGGESEFSHVVEIYNFPSEFKTQDLLSVFAPYKNGGFEIKWVDDTHALGVFSSSRVAADVLAYEHPFVKTRPLSEATPESRIKARRSAEFLQPYRARPETCVAMARRLVTGALGMRVSTSREEREAERRLLKEAREKRRLAAQQQQDAWEGTIR